MLFTIMNKIYGILGLLAELLLQIGEFQNIRNSTNPSPQIDFTIDAYNYSGGLQVSSDTANVIKTGSVPKEQYTEKIDLRVRGRSIAVKLESTQVGTTWRSGLNRFDIRPDGKR